MRFYRVLSAAAICLVLGACDDGITKFYTTDATAVPVSTEIVDQYWENPLPLPIWLDNVERTAVQRGERLEICATINGGAIVQPGQAHLDGALWKIMTITVDWQIVKNFTIGSNLVGVMRGDGAVIGQTFSCIDVGGFSSGRHLAHIEINLTHQVQYDHTWAFEIP